ncbi:50S ribosomal protein L4 [Faecalibacter rhinopitheci]|uniref:Large ribosomal subunit protein uL4 n=1 Tax=Faecalibacter rhinopitheci TaxID=2779678 RepID=A0A8J7FQ19_9FLAO|nr:50S ribosomal protein L4 [Faecalibacter rhinopitheci]MBF0597434.1 50S ribosomal protein L4 [Faecalibacter rhinopitheci]MBQ0147147.1 50S ribosomal protein L4 [Candidatus Onthonaster equi]
MEVVVLNINGQETGRTVSLDEQIFGIEPSTHTVYLEVKQYLAAQRQGTHKSKERAEIAGSTRKIKKQKGTGTARAGSIKSPVFRGGGRVFGPRPRNYSFKLNKAQKRLAKKSVLSQKLADNEIKVIENFTFEAPKTKEFKSLLSNLGLEGKKSLFVLGESNNNVYLSSRNLQKTKVVTTSELNVYDLINASEIIFLEGSLASVQENLSK